MRLWNVVLGVVVGCSGGPAPGDDATPVDVRPPTHPVVESTSLGTVAPDGATGVSLPVTFEVPDDAVSFLLVADGARGVTYGFDSLSAPDGTPLVPPGWSERTDLPVCLECKNRVLNERSAAALLDPIAPVSFVQGGRWTVRLRSEAPAALRLLVKRAPGPVAEGVIDLRLHLTGSHGLTAATAPSDPRLGSAIDGVRTILAQSHIDVDLVTFVDIDPGLQVIDADDLEDLFAARQGADDAVAVFLVSELTASGTPLLGLTAVPGPAGPGTLRSGVALSSDPGIVVPLGGDPLGPAMAHEIGHYLGLFHTRELQGAIFDPLADTPEQSQDNLMTPDLRGTSLTPEQGSVARNHPLVR